LGLGSDGFEGSEALELEVWGAGSVFEEVLDDGFVDRGLWRWDSLDAVGGVDGAPGLDETAEGVVGSEVWEERLLGDGTRGVV